MCHAANPSSAANLILKWTANETFIVTGRKQIVFLSVIRPKCKPLEVLWPLSCDKTRESPAVWPTSACIWARGRARNPRVQQVSPGGKLQKRKYLQSNNRVWLQSSCLLLCDDTALSKHVNFLFDQAFYLHVFHRFLVGFICSRDILIPASSRND